MRSKKVAIKKRAISLPYVLCLKWFTSTHTTAVLEEFEMSVIKYAKSFWKMIIFTEMENRYSPFNINAKIFPYNKFLRISIENNIIYGIQFNLNSEANQITFEM